MAYLFRMISLYTQVAKKQMHSLRISKNSSFT